MLRTTMLFGLGVALCFCATPAAGAGRGPDGHGGRHGAPNPAGRQDCATSVKTRLDALPVDEMSPAEVTELLYLREEEKLARDVYRSLTDVHDLPAFKNIAPAEQHHMELLALLIDRYGLDDPVTDDALGKFTDPRLAQLYTELVARGRGSLEDALRVGATIEDMDLADLARLEATTDNADVRMIVSELERGSRNHLRAFTGVLARKGYDPFTPTHLDAATFEAIVASDHESRPGAHATGSGGGKCAGHGRGPRHQRGRGTR